MTRPIAGTGAGRKSSAPISHRCSNAFAPKGPWHPAILRNPIGLSLQGKGPWWDSTNHPPILADPIGLSPQGKGPWWDWKPAKAALELLFWRGELMVRERRGFERVYDLTERVLPSAIDTRPPAAEELGRFIVVRALTALGVAGEKEIRDYIRIGDRDMRCRGTDGDASPATRSSVSRSKARPVGLCAAGAPGGGETFPHQAAPRHPALALRQPGHFALASETTLRF